MRVLAEKEVLVGIANHRLEIPDAYIGRVNNGAWGRTELSTLGLGFSIGEQRFGGAPNTAGDYWIMLRVEDGFGAFTHYDFLLRVTEPFNPPPSPPAAFTPPMVIVGEPYSFTFPSFTDTDAITHWITDVAGAGVPPGLYFDPNSRTLSGTPTARWSGNIRYMAQNGVNAPSSMLVPMIVNERPSVSAGIPMQTAVQGQG